MTLDKETVFLFCALTGSGMFLILTLLRLFGAEETDTDLDFKWLSNQALTGFLMMFGWVGLTCIKEFEFCTATSTLFATCGGFFTLFATGFIFKYAKKLRSDGTVFRLEDAIGKEALVYQSIPKAGSGKINISLNQFTHEINAISRHAEDIPSFTTVHIVEIMDEKTVIVTPK